MADITTKLATRRCTGGGLLGVLVTLLGCATVPPTAVSRANQIAYFVTAHEGGEVMDVEACASGPVVLRPWSTPWERIEVLAGARVGDTLRGDAGGCIRYRATLVANRQVLAGPEVLLSAQSEWLMRPVGPVAQAELHFALTLEQQVATAWPALPAGAEAPVTRVSQDPPGTHAAHFKLGFDRAFGDDIKAMRIHGTDDVIAPRRKNQLVSLHSEGYAQCSQSNATCSNDDDLHSG